MRILRIAPEPPGGIGRTVARFDIELTPDVRLFGLRLTTRAAGGYSIYAPNAHGQRVATFSLKLVEQMTSAAIAALTERTPDAQRAA